MQFKQVAVLVFAVVCFFAVATQQAAVKECARSSGSQEECNKCCGDNVAGLLETMFDGEAEVVECKCPTLRGEAGRRHIPIWEYWAPF